MAAGERSGDRKANSRDVVGIAAGKALELAAEKRVLEMWVRVRRPLVILTQMVVALPTT